MTNDLPIAAPRRPYEIPAFLRRIRESLAKLAQKPAGAVFCLNAQEKICFPDEEWDGKVGNFPENPYAIRIGGFPT